MMTRVIAIVSFLVVFVSSLAWAGTISEDEKKVVVTESMVRKMRPGSVIIDLSIDQGGCVETSRPTTLSDPVFKKHGIIHYCVPNVPSSVARTASHALNNVIVPFVKDIAENGRASFQRNLALRRGVYLFSGHCTHEGLAGLLDCEYSNLDALLV